MYYKRRARHRGSRAKDFLVSVTARRNNGLQGVVTHVISQQSREFRSLLELVSLIHDRLEEMGVPVSGKELRTWTQPQLTLEGKGDLSMDEKSDGRQEPKVGDSAFLVRIMFRQNATWMGEIQWLEGEKKLYFRSMMELIMLIQEALDISGSPTAEYRFRTWDDVEEDASRQSS